MKFRKHGRTAAVAGDRAENERLTAERDIAREAVAACAEQHDDAERDALRQVIEKPTDEQIEALRSAVYPTFFAVPGDEAAVRDHQRAEIVKVLSAVRALLQTPEGDGA